MNLHLKATVESWTNESVPETIRDEHGGLYRVRTTALGMSLLALEEIPEGGDDPDERTTVGMEPCAIATWCSNDIITVTPCTRHGENFTAGDTFEDELSFVYYARPEGWTEFVAADPAEPGLNQKTKEKQ